MIRFLQKDNRVVKIIFIVIIAVAVVTMVITLVPGIFADENTSTDAYATVHSGGLMGRYFGTSTTITTPEVQQVAERILQQKKYPEMVLAVPDAAGGASTHPAGSVVAGSESPRPAGRRC